LERLNKSCFFTALDNQKAYFDKKDKSSTSEMSTAVKNAIGLTMLMGWKD